MNLSSNTPQFWVYQVTSSDQSQMKKYLIDCKIDLKPFTFHSHQFSLTLPSLLKVSLITNSEGSFVVER